MCKTHKYVPTPTKARHKNAIPYKREQNRNYIYEETTQNQSASK